MRATGWVSFFTDLGSELIYPLLPDFVTRTLGASRRTFGLIEGLAEGIPALARFWSGALADRAASRKGLVFLGYLISSCVKPFIGMAHSAGTVLGLRVFDRLGKGIRTAPRDAIVADFAGERRGRAFGFQRAMDHAGAVGGGLVGFALLRLLHLDLRWAIALSAIPGLLALLTILLFVHDDPARRGSREGDSRAGGARAADRRAGGTPQLSRAFALYAVAASLFALANSSDAFLILRAREMGLPLFLAPLAWALLHVVKSATSIWGGELSDRVGRRPVLLFGWVLYAAIYGAFAWLSGAWAAWVLFAGYGVFFGATEGVAKAYVADLVPAASRGRAFGLLGMLEGLLLIPTSFAVGWLWDATGSGRIPLAVEAGLALCAAAWLGIVCRDHSRASGRS